MSKHAAGIHCLLKVDNVAAKIEKRVPILAGKNFGHRLFNRYTLPDMFHGFRVRDNGACDFRWRRANCTGLIVQALGLHRGETIFF